MMNLRDIILGIFAAFFLIFSFVFFLVGFSNPVMFLIFYFSAAGFFIIIDHAKDESVSGFLPITQKSIINRFFRYNLYFLKFIIVIIGIIGIFAWIYIYWAKTNPYFIILIPHSTLIASIIYGIIIGLISSILVFSLGLKLDDGKKHFLLTICVFFGSSLSISAAALIVVLAFIYFMGNKSEHFVRRD